MVYFHARRASFFAHMAFVFLPMYLRKGYTTLPEFMEERYGVGVCPRSDPLRCIRYHIR